MQSLARPVGMALLPQPDTHPPYRFILAQILRPGALPRRNPRTPPLSQRRVGATHRSHPTHSYHIQPNLPITVAARNHMPRHAHLWRRLGTIITYSHQPFEHRSRVEDHPANPQ